MLTRIRERIRESLVAFAFLFVAPKIFRLNVFVALLLDRLWLHIPHDTQLDLSQIKRVVVIRLDAIGDGVLNTVFLRELKHHLPDAEITLIVNEQLYPVFSLCPYVDEVLRFDCSVPFRWKPFLLPWRALLMAKTKLWRKGYDLAVLPRREFDMWAASFLAFFSRARWRVAYAEHVNDRKHRLNPGADRLFTHTISPHRDLQHEVLYNLGVVEFLGGSPTDDRIELWTSREDEAVAEQLLSSLRGGEGALLIAVSPGASSSLRRWPIKNFAELMTSMAEKMNCRFVVIGSSAESDFGESLARTMPGRVLNLVGKTTLCQCAAVLKRCSLVIGNDSGPLHIAAAVGTSVVALFGSSCEHRFGPWKHHAVATLDLPCRPCNQGHVVDSCAKCIFDEPRCFTDLPVKSVLAIAERVLSVAVTEA